MTRKEFLNKFDNFLNKLEKTIDFLVDLPSYIATGMVIIGVFFLVPFVFLREMIKLLTEVIR